MPVYYCPYLLSTVSERNLSKRLPEYLKEHPDLRISVTPTYNIPISPCLSNARETDIDENKLVAKLCEKYYDKFVEDKHILESGEHALYGYGRAGLTLVLQSNCPNNTIPLIWHEFNDWYPLFPRVIHHRE